MADLTPAERIAAGQHRRWAGRTPEQRRADTMTARYGADTRFEREADPDGTRSFAERAVLGALLREAHYAQLQGA